MIIAGQLVKTAEKLVQQPDQLLSGALRRQNGEADDIGEPTEYKTEGHGYLAGQDPRRVVKG